MEALFRDAGSHGHGDYRVCYVGCGFYFFRLDWDIDKVADMVANHICKPGSRSPSCVGFRMILQVLL